MRALPSAHLGLCISLLFSLPAPALGAGQTTSTEDVPVRGGVAALAAAASMTPAPDRARAVAEIARTVYSWPQTGPYSNEGVRRGIAAFFADAAPPAATETVPVPTIQKAVLEVFDLRPAAIIEDLDLLRPIYAETAAYGHFGRELPNFTWERTDRVDGLKKAAGV